VSTEEQADQVVQMQITHMAEQTMRATGAEVAIVITVLGPQAIQSAIASRVPDNSPATSAEQLQKAVRAITLTAAGCLEQSTKGKYKLLVMGPNGVEPAAEGLDVVLVEKAPA